jgi:uncharacterized membrane protein YgcG
MALRLPRLPSGMFPQQFQVWWQRVVEALEKAVTDIVAVNTAQSGIIADLTAQLALIQAAQTTATAAARESARINSYTSPTNLLTAADAGTDASITVAAHTRVYPVQGSVDVANVAIAGGTVSGLAFSTQYAVFYDDATLAATAPTFQATTTLASAQVGAAEGRHFVGIVTTPADGGGSTTGSGGYPPGGGGGAVLP